MLIGLNSLLLPHQWALRYPYLVTAAEPILAANCKPVKRGFSRQILPSNRLVACPTFLT